MEELERVWGFCNDRAAVGEALLEANGRRSFRPVSRFWTLIHRSVQLLTRAVTALELKAHQRFYL